MNELEKLDIEDMGEEQKYERFKIGNLEQANWALRKISAFVKKIGETNQLADKEVERIEEWRQAENNKVKNSMSFFEGLLIEYFTKEKAKDPKFKISSPYGKVSTRKQQSQWIFEDEEFIKYIEAAKPDLIRIKKEVNKADFKKIVGEGKEFSLLEDKIVNMESGEVVSGVSITEQPEKIIIKAL